MFYVFFSCLIIVVIFCANLLFRFSIYELFLRDGAKFSVRQNKEIYLTFFISLRVIIGKINGSKCIIDVETIITHVVIRSLLQNIITKYCN